jgi:hypothetical protein
MWHQIEDVRHPADRQFCLFRQHHAQDRFRTYRRLGLAAAGFPATKVGDEYFWDGGF